MIWINDLGYLFYLATTSQAPATFPIMATFSEKVVIKIVIRNPETES